jgi:hypothetical protein
LKQTGEIDRDLVTGQRFGAALRRMVMRQLRGLCAAAFSIAILTDSAGAQMVPQLRISEEMRINGETESLSSFRTIAVGRDGRIVVPQNDDGQVRFFDAKGRMLGTFGRRGRGPGEFSSYFDGTMGWHGDTLWIFDFNQRRITLISPDLRLVRTLSTVEQAATAAAASGDVKRVPMTNLHVEKIYVNGTMLAQWGFGPQDSESYASTDRHYVVINQTGDVLRNVVAVAPSGGRVFARIGDAVHSSDVPFATKGYTAVSPDGNQIVLVSPAAISGRRGTYRVTVVRATGDTVFNRTHSYDGIPIPRAMIDSAMNQMLQRGRGGAGGRNPGEELAAKARPLLPQMFAPVRGVHFGEDDTVWLAVHDTGPNQRYRGLDASGAVIGDVVLPHRSVLAAASRTRFWALEFDDDGVPSVVVFRVSAR